MIPVSRPHIDERVARAAYRVALSGWITQGAMVQKFEEEIGKILGVPAEWVVACSSGTAALHLAMASAQLGQSEVMVPDLTYVATGNAVEYVNGYPVLVDIGDDWNIDLEDAEKKINRDVRAIVAVHLYGVPCNMSAIKAFAKEHDLIVIEDAAQGLGAMSDSWPCGTLGHYATFSFYGNKLITCGEGGAVVSQYYHQRVRFLRGQAQSAQQRFFHSEVGFNYRMTDVMAAIGYEKAKDFYIEFRDRLKIWGYYRAHIDPRYQAPCLKSEKSISPWLATLSFPSAGQKDWVAKSLAQRDVETRPVFVPLHRMPMFRVRHRTSDDYPVVLTDADFPRATAAHATGLSIPTYYGLLEHELAEICETIAEAAEVAA